MTRKITQEIQKFKQEINMATRPSEIATRILYDIKKKSLKEVLKTFKKQEFKTKI